MNNVSDMHDSSLPQRLALDRIKPRIGDVMRLSVGGTTHDAVLIGYLKSQSLIVSLPEQEDGALQLRVDQPLSVRFISNNRHYEFGTTVRHIANEPFRHLHLVYPDEVLQVQGRQHERIRVNISGIADVADGKSLSCIVRDISMGGALIAIDGQAGMVSDQLVLTLKVAIDGVEYSLSLDSEIRSVRIDASDEADARVLQGLAFRDLSENEVRALAAFELLPDWTAGAGVN